MNASRDIAGLIAIMARLRTPGEGCAWDLAQTHATLAPYALEEAFEVVDAIERGDLEDLRDELGDLLLQVVFHARVAEEAGAFAFGEVVESISAKMLRRHPHVFAADAAAAAVGSAADDRPGLERSWEAIKASERAARGENAGSRGVLADVPLALPGMTRALKLQKKAAAVGFDWGDARLVLAKLREELDEIEVELNGSGNAEAVAGEIGDLLFAAVNLARHSGTDPEAAVRATNRKFERRFAFIEAQLAARGSSPAEASLETMDAIWDEAKARGL